MNKQVKIPESKAELFGVKVFDLPKAEEKVSVDFNQIGLNEFRPKRCDFWQPPVYDWRGHYAHRRANALMVCVEGDFYFEISSGVEEDSFLLEEGEAVFVRKMIWMKAKKCEESSYLMSLTDSERNLPEDFILEYEKWKNELTDDESFGKKWSQRKEKGSLVKVFLHDVTIPTPYWRIVVVREGELIDQRFLQLQDPETFWGTGVEGPSRKDLNNKDKFVQKIIKEI